MSSPSSDDLLTVGAMAAGTNLTSSQLQIWLGQSLSPDAPLYNMVLAFEIDGTVDARCFEQAFDALVERCDALRTVFDAADGSVRRRVEAHRPGTIEHVDLSAQTDPEAACRQWLQARAVRVFDLSERLFDAALLKLREDRYVWFLNQHHLNTDAWSASVLYRRMADLYRHAREGTLDAAPPAPSFEAYVEFERGLRETTRFRKAARHWQQQARERLDPVRPYGAGASATPPGTARVACALGADRVLRLRDAAARRELRALTPGLSLFNAIAVVLFAFLHRIGEASSIAIGAPAHNRSSAALKDTAGLLIELFPLHVRIEEGETFASLAGKVRGETQRLVTYAVPGSGSVESSRAYNVVLNFINASFGDFDGMPARTQWIHPGAGDPSHLMRLQVSDFDDAGVQLDFDLDTGVFEPSQRQRVVEHFLRVLDAFVDDPEQPIGRPSLLSTAQRDAALAAAAGPTLLAPGGATVPALIEEQARRAPERVAIRTRPSASAHETLTYAELETRAGALAATLRSRGVGAGAIVAVCARRSPALVVALYGISKAGAAFLPLDPAHPDRRLEFMLADSGASLLLGQASFGARLSTLASSTSAQVELLELDQPDALAAEGPGADGPSPADLAYVIYTSGSTGAPKGTLVRHSNLLDYLWWARDAYRCEQGLDFPLYSSIAFDLTITSVFLPLLTGGCVVTYAEDDTANDLLVMDVVEDDAVDVLKLTPSHLSLVRERIGATQRLSQLILGGEQLRTDLALSVVRSREGVAIHNEYGPTEATVGCMIHTFDPSRDTGPTVPIGGPAANASIYLLDANGEPVPDGLTGELCVGGPAVTAGYLGREALTAERFVPDPARPGETMYRTGDLARRTPAGPIELVGRADRQVKVRGARIEPAEVEAALAGHERVAECVVSVLEPRRAPESGVVNCWRCGIPSNHPDAAIDESGLCDLCVSFERYRTWSEDYFGTLDDLAGLLDERRALATGEHDCLMLLSGGKDSTYALHRLVDLGCRPLVFTLDNGYISEDAKANIRRVVDDLGLELILGSTPAMPSIFAESLRVHANVCNGCFKTIYTLSTKLARDRGIPTIVTGLSRGQIFETRLADLYRIGVHDNESVERTIVEARKAYHRMDDKVSRCLDVELFQDDAVFDEVRFVDFYRYCDAPLEELMDYLGRRASWIRPRDTGRSTNCRINDVGIFVHKRVRGYHNYALPYSWDVRLGHKTRDAALDELDDEIDESKVEAILEEIGFDATQDGAAGVAGQLTAFYVSPQPLPVSELRRHLAERLPEAMIPARFARIDEVPLTANGKVDHDRLATLAGDRPELAAEYVAPRTSEERELAQLWASVLGLERVGVHDEFIEIGGDSILAIQIVARAREVGLQLNARTLLEHSTIATLAGALGSTPAVDAEQGPVTGEVALAPIQRWLLEGGHPTPERWDQTLRVELREPVDAAHLEQALGALWRHHDALRLRFTRDGDRWRQRCAGVDAAPPRLERRVLGSLGSGDRPQAERDRQRQDAIAALQGVIDLAEGPTLAAALLETEDRAHAELHLVVHHLAVDGVSWPILLRDLETACRRLAAGEEPRLPAKTTSFKRWAGLLAEIAERGDRRAELDHWRAALGAAAPLPVDAPDHPLGDQDAAAHLTTALDASDTRTLLEAARASGENRSEDLLLTALALALARWTGSETVAIDLEHHGRDGWPEAVDLSRTVGWFTSMFPVRLTVPAPAAAAAAGWDDEHVARALEGVEAGLRSVPGNGAGYGLLRYLDPGSGLGALATPPVRFNYLGRLDGMLGDSTLFRYGGALRGYYGERNRRPHLLDVAAFVVEERLRVEWSYDRGVHRTETMATLARDFESALLAAIARARASTQDPSKQDPSKQDPSRKGPSRKGPSPQDFPDADLDQGDLDALLDEFRE